MRILTLLLGTVVVAGLAGCSYQLLALLLNLL